ncbi:hypothetical protein SBRY_20366 [Actinacidiphila bryophytorum]|uniref:Uncharacterized protein n=1 Tax=Actinacidiphila bryophytorum TaxID=1436133 RepID=A0A9W4E9D3_9ACTN|nr:hypothetical protein SBRY_20366 [Actinacidiphila bryophytorum]
MDLPADLQLLVRPGRRPRAPHRRPGRAVRRRHPHHARRPPLGRAERRRAGRRPGWAPAGVRRPVAGQLVPGPGHRAGQRGGHRGRPLRARQLPGLQGQPAAVDDAHHRLRRPAAVRPGQAGLARGDQAAAAQLDRPQRGRQGRLRRAHRRRPGRRGHCDHRLHHPPGHAVRRDVHGAGARARTGRGHRPRGLAGGHPPGVDRRPCHALRRRRRLPQAGRVEVRRGKAGGSQGQDRRLHRRLRREPGQRRPRPGLHRRLRPDGLRHRRHHGRPRPRHPRLRLRPRLRTAHALRRPAHRRPRHRSGRLGRRLRLLRRHDRQLRRLRHLTGRPGRRRGQGRGHPLAERARHRRGHRQLPAARLAVQPAALLGRTLPDRLRRGRRPARPARLDAARRTARGGRLQPAHLRPGRRRHLARDPAVPQCRVDHRRTGPGRRPAHVPPRDQHHAQLGRFLLVRTALPGPAQQRAAGRPGGRVVLDGPARGPAGRRRRPVRRRRGTRRAAPAVRPLLAQGAVRPGPRLVLRALPQAVQPGHDPGLRLPRRAPHRRPRGRGRGTERGVLVRRRAGQPAAGQDGQVAEERGHARRDLCRVRRRHPAAVRDGHGAAGRLPPLGAAGRRRPVPAAAAAVAQRGGRGDRRGHRLRRRARRGDAARAAQGHRRRQRRHGGAALQHRHRQDHRAEQPPDQGRGARAAPGRGTAGAADRPAGAAHRRGAVVQAGPHHLADPRRLPRRRPGPGPGPRGDLRRPDQGQGQGPPGGLAHGLRGRPGGAGTGRPRGRRGAGRRGDPQGHRARAEAGQHRRLRAAASAMAVAP